MQRQGRLHLVENIREGFTEKVVFEVWLTIDEIKLGECIQSRRNDLNRR